MCVYIYIYTYVHKQQQSLMQLISSYMFLPRTRVGAGARAFRARGRFDGAAFVVCTVHAVYIRMHVQC